MEQVGVLRSIQVGTPAQYPLKTRGKYWETSFFRIPSPQPRWLSMTQLEGNVQADTKHHGKPSQVVLMYAAAHYPLWQQELERTDMGPGGFGENFTVDDISEQTVCIGDIYAIGEAHIQVTGPRYPCTKIERRWRTPGLTDRAAQTGRTGWYCSTVREGMVEPGVPILLVERPYPQWSIALINDFAHYRNQDLALAKQIATCPVLDPFWRRLVVKRAQGEEW